MNMHEKRFRLFEVVLYGGIVITLLDDSVRAEGGFVLQKDFTKLAGINYDSSSSKLMMREFLVRLVEDDVLVCRKVGARNSYGFGSKFDSFVLFVDSLRDGFPSLVGCRYLGA